MMTPAYSMQHIAQAEEMLLVKIYSFSYVLISFNDQATLLSHSEPSALRVWAFT